MQYTSTDLEGSMAEQDRIRGILAKLQQQSKVTADEVAELQTHIDELENRGLSEATHHESHATPGSHYTNHHSSATNVIGFLENISQERIRLATELGRVQARESGR
jgi:hypothetical protein